MKWNVMVEEGEKSKMIPRISGLNSFVQVMPIFSQRVKEEEEGLGQGKN